MTAKTVFGLAAGVAATAVLMAGTAMAHDPRGKGGIPPAIAARIAAARDAQLNLDSSDAAKGIYAKSVQWPPTYAKLRVCFMGGEDANNAKVAEIGAAWLNDDAATGMKLDFGKKGKPRRCKPDSTRESQIRISYDKPGYWSVVGQVSVVYLKQDEASMGLEGLGDAKLEAFDIPEVRGTIIHEFGHALGLLHEHQSPVSTCANEFNWEYIVKYLSGPPNNWSEDQIKTNMATEVGEDLMMTDFDSKSVMLYYFPEEFYAQGSKATCFIEKPNDDISETDRGTVQFMYPSDTAQREANYGQVKQGFQAILQKAEAEGRKSAGIDFMGAYFSGKGVAADETDE